MNIVPISDRLEPPGRLSDRVMQSQLHVHGDPFAERISDESFRVSKGRDGRIDVSGEVDFFSAKSFGAAFSAAIPSSGVCWVELGRLRFIDSAGIRAIIRSANSVSTGLRLCSATPTLRKCWALLECNRAAPNVSFWDA